MKVAIMQPYIFPYIGYFQLINSVDKFVFYDDVAFIKQGWINRNNILLNATRHLFTIPVINISSNCLINEILISSKPDNWDKKFLQTLTHAYKKAPYFKSVFSMIAKLVENKRGCTISKLAQESIIVCAEYLGISTSFFCSSELEKRHLAEDRADRVINITNDLGGKIYINAIGGTELYNKEYFKSKGIELFFLKPNPIEYKQFNNAFINNLSIIDLIMFNTPSEIQELIKRCEIL